MNAIIYGVNEVKFNIHSEILNLIYSNGLYTIEDNIVSTVIKPKVLMDLNLIGGVTTYVPLSRCQFTVLSEYQTTFIVPKVLTNNRSIVSVMEIITRDYYIDGTNTMVNLPNPENLETYQNMLSGNIGTVGVFSKLELIGENTVTVYGQIIDTRNLFLHCKIENDNGGLNNIKPRSYTDFAKLVLLATKADIYNKFKVKYGETYINMGHEMSVLAEIINSYENAYSEYIEYRDTVWNKVALMNDEPSYNAFIQSMIGM